MFIEKIKEKLIRMEEKYNDTCDDEESMANDLLDYADEVIALQSLLISEYEKVLKK
ncbi:hypothetical protein [Clostridium sp.]|uniref:hypothetical protein n=1 Tax=Clostridium sp. TaxID=1506 RepID=UPI001A4A4FDD|nr:hypothetical protein [Clostridium sp.]MBK5242159.1 hypothetical protein [Clostridium sp.]